MGQANKVVVVGSANIDLVVTAPRLPAPGETILGHSMTRGLGGKGSNQAVAAARAGSATMLVAAIGKDEFSERIREGLHVEGIDQSLVATHATAPTGAALVTVDDAGANTIVVTRGANELLDPDTVDSITGLLQPGDVILMQLEIPVDACARAVTIAKDAGAVVVLNAAPAPEAAADIAELLSGVDLLIVNQVEAASLCGVTAESNSAWPVLASELRKSGPSAVVITMGEHGAFLADGDGHTYVPAPAVPVIDTTGAGDTFCGFVASGLAAGVPLAESVRLACIAGALATTGLGAQAAVPTLSAVRDADNTQLAARAHL